MRWEMRLNLLWLLMLVIFLLEGALFPWLIPDPWTERVMITPHFMLVGLVFIAIYVNRYAALIYGLVFGFLQDLYYYGHMLGVHAFTLGLIGYIVGLYNRRGRIELFSTLGFIAVGEWIYGSLQYAIYHFFNVTAMMYQDVLIKSILPSMMINLLFALLIYIPARWYFEESLPVRKEDE